jgi:hypothetical protein
MFALPYSISNKSCVCWSWSMPIVVMLVSAILCQQYLLLQHWTSLTIRSCTCMSRTSSTAFVSTVIGLTLICTYLSNNVSTVVIIVWPVLYQQWLQLFQQYCIDSNLCQCQQYRINSSCACFTILYQLKLHLLQQYYLLLLSWSCTSVSDVDQQWLCLFQQLVTYRLYLLQQYWLLIDSDYLSTQVVWVSAVLSSSNCPL